jgi:hypothetical protein
MRERGRRRARVYGFPNAPRFRASTTRCPRSPVTKPPPPASFDVHAVTREMAAEVIGISTRRFHELIADGTLPKPVRHGVHDLPACIRAYGVYRAEWTMPTSWDDAFRGVVKARALFEEFVRRHPEQCPAGLCDLDNVMAERS